MKPGPALRAREAANSGQLQAEAEGEAENHGLAFLFLSTIAISRKSS